jgi:hypothetical protein
MSFAQFQAKKSAGMRFLGVSGQGYTKSPKKCVNFTIFLGKLDKSDVFGKME